METTERPSDDGGGTAQIDPQLELRELELARSKAEIEAWLPLNPLWYAPLLALMIDAAVAGGRTTGVASIAAYTFALALAAFGMAHTAKRGFVKPRRRKKPLRLLLPYGLMLAITWASISFINGVTSMATHEWPQSHWALPAGLAIGWVGSTIAISLGLLATNRIHDRWMDGAQ